ncbi:Kelch repeat-containing protein [Bacteroidota bacterium]
MKKYLIYNNILLFIIIILLGSSCKKETVPPDNFEQGVWVKISDMPQNRGGHTVNEINGKVYVIGGSPAENTSLSISGMVFEWAANTWIELPHHNNGKRILHTSCVVEGKLYVLGGWTNDSLNSTSATMDMFNPQTGEWISKKSMPTHRANLTCAVIEGKIYVIGGMQNNPDGTLNYNGLKVVEMYDRVSDTWLQLQDMPTGRWGSSAVAVDGKIYVIGGRSASHVVLYSSIEVYDPETDSWSTKAGMPTERYQLTTCLLDGKIYAIGGWKNSSTGPIYDKVEVYDPVNDAWITESPMPVSRAILASIAIDGKILVYGGSRTNHPLIGTSAVYEFTQSSQH